MKIKSRKTNGKVFRQKVHADAKLHPVSYSPGSAEFWLDIDGRLYILQISAEEMKEMAANLNDFTDRVINYDKRSGGL
jgi:hypothetical protein